MKTLIVDNGSKLLNELCRLAPQPTEVVEWNNLKKENLSDVSLIVLSGTSNLFSIKGHEESLNEEIDLILNSGKPIIGICYGCELIARSFGAKLEKMDTEERKIAEVKIIKKDKIFDGLESFTAYEAHHWVVKEIPNELQSLAVSEHGVEIFRHKNLPIYGIQFHPEKEPGVSATRKIFNNIVKEILL